MARVLLIEDNEFNRDLISRYLELFGHEVLLASNGEEGIRTACEAVGQLELILMDINLPEIDGFETTRRLKANPLTAALPVVAITAHAMVGDRERALEAGCDDYTTKPVDFGALLSKIESFSKKAIAL